MRFLGILAGSFLFVLLSYILLGFIPGIFNVVFWPQSFAQKLGFHPWQSWRVRLEIAFPALAWALTFGALAALISRRQSVPSKL